MKLRGFYKQSNFNNGGAVDVGKLAVVQKILIVVQIGFLSVAGQRVVCGIIVGIMWVKYNGLICL